MPVIPHTTCWGVAAEIAVVVKVAFGTAFLVDFDRKKSIKYRE